MTIEQVTAKLQAQLRAFSPDLAERYTVTLVQRLVEDSDIELSQLNMESLLYADYTDMLGKATNNFLSFKEFKNATGREMPRALYELIKNEIEQQRYFDRVMGGGEKISELWYNLGNNSYEWEGDDGQLYSRYKDYVVRAGHMYKVVDGVIQKISEVIYQ